MRVIAATNVDPADAVQKGKLREDLYYRLNVFAIHLPPLRERREDIPLLVQTFLNEFNARNNKSVRAVSQEAMRVLEQLPWPGNIRELQNVIERATILAERRLHRAEAPAAKLIERSEERAADADADARDDGGGGRAAAHHADARAHPQQQDARGRDSGHQPEDAAQQAQ